MGFTPSQTTPAFKNNLLANFQYNSKLSNSLYDLQPSNLEALTQVKLAKKNISMMSSVQAPNNPVPDQTKVRTWGSTSSM